MEYVLIDNEDLGLVLIWINGSESGVQKEFETIEQVERWVLKAQIEYRWARPEEVMDLV